jgi:putative hydrolase of the HAD superfamily
MKAVAFDLGDTLVEYEGMPLSWEEHYPAALAQLAAFLGTTVHAPTIEAGCAVLRRYNTRPACRANW